MVRSSRVGALPSDLGPLIDKLDDHGRRISTLEAPSGESAEAIAARTLANVEELLTRRTIANESTYSYLVQAGVDPIPFTTPDLAVVNFTLTERRKVYLQVSAGTGTLVVHNGTGAIYNPIVVVQTGVRLYKITEGTDDYGSSATESGVGGNAGLMALARTGGRLIHNDYRTLDAGDYSIAYVGRVDDLTGTQASVRIYNPRASVEIMEKA
jgi:hypothetical protein